MTEKQLRSKVVSIMQGWVGLKESDGSFKPIIDLYNSHKPLARGYKVQYNDEWCAATVSAAFIKAGLVDIAPTECSCSKMIELYKKLGCFKETDSYRPSPGDVLMYDWQDNAKGDNTGAPDHVGIVEKVVGNTITIIEGNKGQAVARRTLAVNGKYIRGYCLPAYHKKATKASKASETTKVELPILESGREGDSVEALQILLNGYGFNCGTVDGSFGSKTLAAVKAYQKALKLTADGCVGPATWAALLGI